MIKAIGVDKYKTRVEFLVGDIKLESFIELVNEFIEDKDSVQIKPLESGILIIFKEFRRE